MSDPVDRVILEIRVIIERKVPFSMRQLNEMCRKHGIPEYVDGNDITAWLQGEASNAVDKEAELLSIITTVPAAGQRQTWTWKEDR